MVLKTKEQEQPKQKMLEKLRARKISETSLTNYFKHYFNPRKMFENIRRIERGKRKKICATLGQALKNFRYS